MSEIGSGSYGHVFRVQQKSSLGLFAIKKIAIRDEIEPFKELCTSLLISKLSDSDISLPLVWKWFGYWKGISKIYHKLNTLYQNGFMRWNSWTNLCRNF